MTQAENEVPEASNWADEIDELNRSVTETHLQAVFWRRIRKPASAANTPDDEVVEIASAEKN
jgi:hypothetical protein